MNKKFCFIGNYNMTYLFEEIAKYLPSVGIEVYWILTKDTEYNRISPTAGTDHILKIDKSYILKENKPLGDFKIKELIYGDRAWKYDKVNGIRFLQNIQKPIYDFITRNKINIVFGEVTWAHEIVIHRMCSQLREMNCSFYPQILTRIPDGRFFFFKDEKLTKVLKIDHDSTVTLNEIPVKKPAYLSINTKIAKGKLSSRGLFDRFMRFVKNEEYEKNDPAVISNFYVRVRHALGEIYNQQTYRLVKRSSAEVLNGEKYILYGFHKQPEASVDVCGRYNEDQFQVVLNLWRQLPPGWKLAVKEHSIAIGDRSLNFYNKLLKYPDIVLINELEDSHKLMKNAQMVVVNTGTIGLEAALMGIPTITLSKVVFNCLNYCRHMNWEEIEKYDSLLSIINEIKEMDNNKVDFDNLVNNYSFEGYFLDVKAMPSVLDYSNISKLVKSIVALFDYKNQKKTEL